MHYRLHFWKIFQPNYGEVMYLIYCHLLGFFAICVLHIEIVNCITKKNDETSNLTRKYLDRLKKQNDELKTRNEENFKTKMSKIENLEHVGEGAKVKGMASRNQAEYIQNCALLKSFGALEERGKCKEIIDTDETSMNDSKMEGSKRSGKKTQKTDSIEFSELAKTTSDTGFRGSGHKIKLGNDEKIYLEIAKSKSTMNEPEEDSEETRQKSVIDYRKYNFKHSKNPPKNKSKINTDSAEVRPTNSRLHLKKQQLENDSLITESLKINKKEVERKAKEKLNANEENYSEEIDETTLPKDYNNKNASTTLNLKKIIRSPVAGSYASYNSTKDYGFLSESLTQSTSRQGTLQATKLEQTDEKISPKTQLSGYENISIAKGKNQTDTQYMKISPSSSSSGQNEPKYQNDNSEIDDDDKIKYSPNETLEESKFRSAAITDYATPNSRNTENYLSEKLTTTDFENKSDSEILKAILKKVPSEDSLTHTNLTATSNDSDPTNKLPSKFNIYSVHMESSSKVASNEVAYYEIKKINGSDVGNVKSSMNESATDETNLDDTLEKNGKSLNRMSDLQKSLDGETNSKERDVFKKLLTAKKTLNTRYRFVPIPNLPLVKPVGFTSAVVTLNKTPLKIPTIQNERKAIAINKQTQSSIKTKAVSNPKQNNAKNRPSKAPTRSKQSKKDCASVFFPKNNSKQNGSNGKKNLANFQYSSILLGRIFEAPFTPKFQKCLDNIIK